MRGLVRLSAVVVSHVAEPLHRWYVLNMSGIVGWGWVAALATISCASNVERGGCSTDVECKGDRVCVKRTCVSPNEAPSQEAAPGEDASCGSSGYCTTTSALFSGDLAGLEGADRQCAAEFPGSHFYRRS